MSLIDDIAKGFQSILDKKIEPYKNFAEKTGLADASRNLTQTLQSRIEEAKKKKSQDLKSSFNQSVYTDKRLQPKFPNSTISKPSFETVVKSKILPDAPGVPTLGNRAKEFFTSDDDPVIKSFRDAAKAVSKFGKEEIAEPIVKHPLKTIFEFPKGVVKFGLNVGSAADAIDSSMPWGRFGDYTASKIFGYDYDELRESKKKNMQDFSKKINANLSSSEDTGFIGSLVNVAGEYAGPTSVVRAPVQAAIKKFLPVMSKTKTFIMQNLGEAALSDPAYVAIKRTGNENEQTFLQQAADELLASVVGTFLFSGAIKSADELIPVIKTRFAQSGLSKETVDDFFIKVRPKVQELIDHWNKMAEAKEADGILGTGGFQRVTSQKPFGGDKKPSPKDIYEMQNPPPIYSGAEEVTTVILNEIKGKDRLSKEWVRNLAKRQGMKKNEIDIINSVLDEYEGKIIPAEEFGKKVEAQLTPLKTIDAGGGYKYVHIDDGIPRQNYKETIYESPIKNDAGKRHFGGKTDSYFAHVRSDKSADGAKRILELQSDLFQKRRGFFDSALKLPKYVKEYANSWYERIIREELKKAAQEGEEVLRFPTGETAMKIEGLVQSDSGFQIAAEIPFDKETGAGKSIWRVRNGETESWIVVHQYGSDADIVNYDAVFDYYRKAFGDSPSPEDLHRFVKDNHNNPEHKEFFDRASENMIIEGGLSEESITKNPIYKFYESAIKKYLNKIADVKEVTDQSNNTTWFEVSLKKDDGSYVFAPDEPVLAFKSGGQRKKTPGDININAETKVRMLEAAKKAIDNVDRQLESLQQKIAIAQEKESIGDIIVYENKYKELLVNKARYVELQRKYENIEPTQTTKTSRKVAEATIKQDEKLAKEQKKQESKMIEEEKIEPEKADVKKIEDAEPATETKDNRGKEIIEQKRKKEEQINFLTKQEEERIARDYTDNPDLEVKDPELEAEQILIDAGYKIGTNPAKSHSKFLDRAMTAFIPWDKVWNAVTKKIPTNVKAFIGGVKSVTPEEYKKMAIKRDAAVQNAAEDFLKVGETLYSGVTKEERLLMGRALRGEITIESLPEHLIERTAEARRIMDNVGAQAVKYGLLNPDTYEKNKGSYLPRMYEAYEAADSVLTEFYGTHKNPTKLELNRFMQRKDLPDEVREALKEILEPAYLVSKGGFEVMRDVIYQNFFKNIVANEDWVRSVETKGYVKMPGDKKWGMLQNKWVQEDIYRDLMDIEMMSTDLQNMTAQMRNLYKANKNFSKTVSWWKKSKIIYNPATHFRNLYSNTFLLDLSGVSYRRQLHLIPRALKHLMANDDVVVAAKKLGVIGNEYNPDDFRKLHDNFKKFDGTHGEAMKLITTIDDAMTGIYQAEEKLFKMVKFMDEISKGTKPWDAAQEAKKWLFDYSDQPKWLKAAGTYWQPFLVFKYKVIPRIMEAAFVRPSKFVKYAVLLSAWETIQSIHMEESPEEMRERREAMPDYAYGSTFGKNASPFTKYLPGGLYNWAIGVEIPNFLTVPVTNNLGETHYLDLSFIFPWNVDESVRNAPEERTIGNMLIDNLKPTTPFLLPAVEIGFNYNTFTKEPLYDENDSAAEKWKKRVNHIYKYLMPSLAPGAGPIDGGYGFQKIEQAIEGRPYSTAGSSPEGRVRTPATAIADALFGLKINPIDMQNTLQYQRYSAEKQYRDYVNDVKSLMNKYQKGVYSEQSFLDEYQKIVDRSANLREKNLRFGFELPVIPELNQGTLQKLTIENQKARLRATQHQRPEPSP